MGGESRSQAHTTPLRQNDERSELMHGKISGVVVGWSETKYSVSDMPPQCGGATLIWEYVLKRSKRCLRHPFQIRKNVMYLTN